MKIAVKIRKKFGVQMHQISYYGRRQDQHGARGGAAQHSEEPEEPISFGIRTPTYGAGCS
jgi:hypothetical protein